MILCIDPSKTRSGISIIDDINNKIIYTTTSGGLLGNFKTIQELIEEYKPRLILKESPYMGINKKTFGILCKVHGGIEILGEMYNIPIVEYTPSAGKKVCGTSTRDKNSKKIVNAYINNYFNTSIESLDVTDSVALYLVWRDENGRK